MSDEASLWDAMKETRELEIPERALPVDDEPLIKDANKHNEKDVKKENKLKNADKKTSSLKTTLNNSSL